MRLDPRPIGPRTGETKTAEYTKLNPRQKVPLLQDGDFCIGESAAIVAYLSRMYSTPERSLIPEASREYAAWLEWCFFVVAELDSTSLYVMRRHRADALGPIYGVAPEVVVRLRSITCWNSCRLIFQLMQLLEPPTRLTRP